MTDDIKAIRDAQIASDIKAIRVHLPLITDLDSRQYHGACHPERIARLLDALEQASKDAERYRWLREVGTVKGVIDWNALEWEYHDLPAMDAAIDAAIRAIAADPALGA